MESFVTSVRHPSMRAEVVLAVRSLADPGYQQRVWIRREYPQDSFFDDLTQNVNILFDDTGALPDPTSAVGDILYPNQVDTMAALGNVLDPLLDELGDADDAQYLDHPQWSQVVRSAQAAYAVLNTNASQSNWRCQRNGGVPTNEDDSADLSFEWIENQRGAKPPLRAPTNHWVVHPQQRARVELLAVAVETPHEHLQLEITIFHTGRWCRVAR